MSEELKPCPFCGKAVSLERNYDITLHSLHKVSIRCIAQNAHYEHALVTGWSDNISGIIEQWNTRAKPTFTKEDAEKVAKIILDNASHYDEMDEFYCFSDGLNFPFSDTVKFALATLGRVEK